ncbi:MAG: ABC transporter permease [Oscillospiraceae bacterium]|nr:ABC transporter permease [Oscillospiraceae bacterium]
MKQFGKILKFELKNYMTNKVFVGVTVFLMALLVVVMFFPRITESIDSGEEVATEDREVMLLVAEHPEIQTAFAGAFPEYDVRLFEGDVSAEITAGKAECAFVLDGLTSYRYYVNNLSMYDMNTEIADEVLQGLYRMSAMVGSGMSLEEAGAILNTTITHEVQMLGKDQMQNYFYTYIMIMALYMVILLYGQMVATNVATEKSSRAMELLITSAKPVSMMFGKVLASCIAGLTQLVAVFGTAFVCFQANKSYWDESGIVASLFDIPLELLVYMLIFFVLGFLIYAFLFGAVGSTASKLEDINTSVMPITLLFIIGFFVVLFSMTSGNVDNLVMKICSFVPFTSPMAMFTRIAMSTVPFWEIAVSIGILIASAVGVGVISAKIYRIGVLLYGTPPKIGNLLKAIRKA